MTIWRPQSTIRFKALGLNWRDNRLLAAEVLGDDGSVKGVRPLGGAVEFGETAEAAVVREFQEELGITVEIVGQPVFMENIYFHEGSIGHEILALFDVEFPHRVFADLARIKFSEDYGVVGYAQWFDVDELDLPGQTQLYPTGLKNHLLRVR